jgi:tRNA pseudouridine38-40 synthase
VFKRKLGISEFSSAIAGTHCFKSFAHPTPKELHYLSSVYKAEWCESEQVLKLEIAANRFLHGMIRLLVGTMVDVGFGRLSVDQFYKVFAAEDVKLASTKAPAVGLCLTAVGYDAWPKQ